MKRGLLLLSVIALGLGFVLWRMGDERDTRAVETGLIDRELEVERDVAELEAPAAVTPDEPLAREALVVEQDATSPLAAPGDGEAALDVEVVSLDTGEPVAGVELYLVAQDESVLREEQETDAEGRATLLAPAEQIYRLKSWKSAAAEASSREVTTPAAGERLALRIELRTLADQSYFGRVVDTETSAPLAGATARFENAEGEPVTSDADGLFVLQSRSWKPAMIRVEHADYAWKLIDTSPEHATPEKARVIRLTRSARLLVRVERVDGPLVGLEVRVHTDDYWMRQHEVGVWWSTSTADPVWVAQVDASGLALVEGLPPDAPLTVDVHAAERLKRLPELRLASGEEREVVIRIGSGCQILGQAFDADGTPAEGLEVWLLATKAPYRGREGRYLESYETEEVAQRTQVDAAGRFAFDDVAPGNWLVGPAPTDRAEPEGVAPLASALQITEQDLQQEVTLAIHRGLTIRGRVVGPDGDNVGHAYVMDRRAWVDCNTQDGNFTLGPLAPGEYELTAKSGEFARSKPVTARAGDQDVVIQLEQGGSIQIAVRGPDGASVSAKVSLIPDDFEAAGFSVMSTSPDEDGSYGFEGLKPGLYHVTANDSFGNFGVLRGLSIRAESGAEERVLSMSPGAHVRVRITGAPEGVVLFPRLLQDGVPVGFGAVDAPIAVAPGAVTVQLQTYDREAERIVVLETREETAIAGEALEVVFEREEEE